jgi:hypothetical protein
MFNLRRLLSIAVDVPALEAFDLEEFARETINKVRGRVIRAPGGPNLSAQVSIRYSQDAAALEAVRSEILRPIGPTVSAPMHAIALRQSLLQPQRIIPLAGPFHDRGTRTDALVGVFRTGESNSPWLLRTFIDTRVAAKGGAVSISGLDCKWLLTPENQLLELESIFRTADPRARSVIVSVPHWPRRVFWVGGSKGEPDTLPENWRLQVLGVGAVRGLEIEVLERPYRQLVDVLRRLREARPHIVLIWEPYVGEKGDAIAMEVGDSNEDAIVIRIAESEFQDALLLTRLELDAALAEWEADARHEGGETAARAGSQPGAGEERCYRKLHGSGIGDIMRRLEDCGHNHWQSTNKAPRAWKGIEYLEGLAPQMLFR